MNYFKFGGLLVLAIIGWALMSMGAGVACFFLVGPCHATDFGIWGARGVIFSWFILTPVYFWKTVQLAWRSSDGNESSNLR